MRLWKHWAAYVLLAAPLAWATYQPAVAVKKTHFWASTTAGSYSNEDTSDKLLRVGAGSYTNLGFLGLGTGATRTSCAPVQGAGAVKKIYAVSNNQPGGSATRVYSIYKFDAVAQTIGSAIPGCTITSATNTCTADLNIAFGADDRLCLAMRVTGSPAASGGRVAVVYEY